MRKNRFSGMVSPGNRQGIYAIIEVSVDESRRRHVIRDLQGLVGPTKAESGCHGCRVLTDSEIPGKVIFFSRWRCELDMRRYFRSEYARTLIGVIEASASPPEGFFGKLDAWQGLEYLQKVRQRN